jgi:RNA polymerase sigma-70 factor (ECF subfamily)
MPPEADARADECLVQLARDGDSDAFTALVHRHQRRVLCLASRFTNDLHAVDDLAQQIFVRAWQKLGQFRGDAPFEHWLARVATRTCYDWIRKQRKHSADVPLDESPELREPHHDRARSDARELLGLAMAQLSPQERLVITLLELEEKSVREIAQLTGWSEANVKVRAFRARAALRTIIEKLQ